MSVSGGVVTSPAGIPAPPADYFAAVDALDSVAWFPVMGHSDAPDGGNTQTAEITP